MDNKRSFFLGIIIASIVSLLFYFLFRNQEFSFFDWAAVASVAGVFSLTFGIIDVKYSNFIGGKWMAYWAHPLNKIFNKKITKAQTSKGLINFVSFRGFSAIGGGVTWVIEGIILFILSIFV